MQYIGLRYRHCLADTMLPLAKGGTIPDVDTILDRTPAASGSPTAVYIV